MLKKPMQKRRNLHSPLFIACAIATHGMSAQSAEWENSAGIAASAVYTDNVCLSQDNKQDQWIGLLTPDVTLKGSGSKANLDLQAAVEINSLTDGKLEDLGCNPQSIGGRKQFSPRVSGSADAVLVDDWMFIDLSASADQNSTGAFFAGGDDSLDRRGNTNTTYRYAVSPYLKHRFKDFADFLLRYSWDDQRNSKDLVGDSSGEKVSLLVNNGSSSAALSWGISGNYDKVSYDDTPGREEYESELKSAQFNLGYQITRTLQVNGFYGQEWNDFVSLSDDIDGDYWDVGLRWTPNSRTTVDVGTGDRFFGDTPRFSIQHRHKRSTFNASYAKVLTYDRDLRTLNDPFPDNGAILPDTPTTLTNSPIVDERFTLGYVYTGRQTTMFVNGNHSNQTRTEDNRDSVFQGASVGMNRKISRDTSLSASLNWNKQDPKDERGALIDTAETWWTSLGATKRISTRANVSLDYRYYDRTSDSVFNSYTENRVTLTLRLEL